MKRFLKIDSHEIHLRDLSHIRRNKYLSFSIQFVVRAWKKNIAVLSINYSFKLWPLGSELFLTIKVRFFDRIFFIQVHIIGAFVKAPGK